MNPELFLDRLLGEYPSDAEFQAGHETSQARQTLMHRSELFEAFMVGSPAWQSRRSEA